MYEPGKSFWQISNGCLTANFLRIEPILYSIVTLKNRKACDTFILTTRRRAPSLFYHVRHLYAPTNVMPSIIPICPNIIDLFGFDSAIESGGDALPHLLNGQPHLTHLSSFSFYLAFSRQSVLASLTHLNIISNTTLRRGAWLSALREGSLPRLTHLAWPATPLSLAAHPELTKLVVIVYYWFMPISWDEHDAVRRDPRVCVIGAVDHLSEWVATARGKGGVWRRAEDQLRRRQDSHG